MRVAAALVLGISLAGCSQSPDWKQESREVMQNALYKMPLQELADSCIGLEQAGVDTPDEALDMMRQDLGELTLENVFPGAAPENLDIPEDASLEDVIRLAAEVLIEVCEAGPDGFPPRV